MHARRHAARPVALAAAVVVTEMQLFSRIALLSLAGALLPAAAAVLPDDRADVLYHYYSGGGVTIDGPSVLIRKKIGQSFSVSGNYYVDSISGASIDVVTTASPYDEERTEVSASIDYLRGNTLLNFGFTNSDENDYTGRSFSLGVSQEMFGAMTTLSLGYVRGSDEVGRSGDPDFAEDLDRRSWRLGLSQVLTRNLIAELSFEAISDQGFLNNPYRQVRYLDPASARGYAFEPEVYPSTRTSTAVALRTRYHLPWRGAMHLEYRYYDDDWGIDAHTAQIGYTHGTVPGFIFDVAYRYYTQGGAEFWSDLYPFQQAQNFLARDKELSSFYSHTLRFGVTYDLFSGRQGFIERGSVSFIYDHMMFNYREFRDIRGTELPGEEPFYSFSADVLQLMFSVWF